MILVLAHLSDLFMQMAWAEANAITPSLELAKLALVTSKDEEEDEAKANPSSVAGTSSSASTDATLVEEAATSTLGPLGSTTLAPPLATSSNSTVLGKRPRDTEMDVDEAVETNTAPKARSPRTEDSPPPDKTMRIDGPDVVDNEKAEIIHHETTPEDIEMVEVSSVLGSAGASAGQSMTGSPTPSAHQTIADTSTANQPPPLPKRQPPPLPPRKQPASDSVMMFGKPEIYCGFTIIVYQHFTGKQHDVSECMDNCMFQIEAALLDFEGAVSVESDKTSVIKRYASKPYRVMGLILRLQPLLWQNAAKDYALGTRRINFSG